MLCLSESFHNTTESDKNKFLQFSQIKLHFHSLHFAFSYQGNLKALTLMMAALFHSRHFDSGKNAGGLNNRSNSSVPFVSQ